MQEEEEGGAVAGCWMVLGRVGTLAMEPQLWTELLHYAPSHLNHFASCPGYWAPKPADINAGRPSPFPI